jgi:hypothetical protein
VHGTYSTITAQQTVQGAWYIHQNNSQKYLHFIKKTLMPFLGYFVVVITAAAQVIQMKELFDTQNALQHL